MKTENKHIGLGVPENYFVDVEGAILREVEVMEAENFLQENYSRNIGFIVPDMFEEALQRDINSATTPTKILSLKRMIKIVSAVAAVLVMALLMYPYEEEVVVAQLNFEMLLAQTSITDEHLDYLDIEDLSWVLEAAAAEDEGFTSIESLDYLLEDEDFLNELASELDNL